MFVYSELAAQFNQPVEKKVVACPTIDLPNVPNIERGTPENVKHSFCPLF